jgi:hypothetical protein
VVTAAERKDLCPIARDGHTDQVAIVDDAIDGINLGLARSRQVNPTPCMDGEPPPRFDGAWRSRHVDVAGHEAGGPHVAKVSHTTRWSSLDWLKARTAAGQLVVAARHLTP